MAQIIEYNGARFIELERGEEIKPGYLLKKEGIGISFHTFQRVTKTMSMIKWNEAATSRFPLVYGYPFRIIGTRGASLVSYTVFKPLEQ